MTISPCSSARCCCSLGWWNNCAGGVNCRPLLRISARAAAPPLPLAGEGWGGGAGRVTESRSLDGVFPHPPRSIERVDLPPKREREAKGASPPQPRRGECPERGFKWFQALPSSH